MTKAQKLPRKLSDLILVSIADLGRAEKSAHYVVEMGIWHDPQWTGGKRPELCEVCLAGTVMAFSLAASNTEWVSPYDYPTYIQRRLNALDDVRIGNVCSALREMNKRTKIPKEFYDWPPMPEYGYRGSNKRAFKANLRHIVRTLQKHGL